ncbi:MAG TPA: hypothetical protein VGJ58_02485 [Gaiellaceae bacterium]|jgi:acyl-coenzyme A thioesterase PaaI-like protein
MKAKAFAPAAAVATAALLALAPTAAADQPVTTELHIDRTRTIAASPDTCPFPFIVHTEGTIRETVFSSGKDVRHAVDFHITYTNPANGKTLTTVLAGPVIVEPNGDGTVTVTINGNDGHLTVPGQGTVFADVGKLVYIADASDINTPLTIVKSTGQQDPNQFPATCIGLS